MHKGWDHAIVVRSTLRHHDQFQIYAGMPGYVELEFTGAPAAFNGNSQARLSLEFVPIGPFPGAESGGPATEKELSDFLASIRDRVGLPR